MAYTFLKSQGQPTGKSLVEDDKLDLARSLLASIGGKIMLPVDHVVPAAAARSTMNDLDTAAGRPDVVESNSNAIEP